ncbi:hypothetical protein BKA69DRAFT_487875 [Paraphysoderma sedebokerense]|nr:hypothetical protein BKA69DRAFT_487875 [Paraphysoderma sedebokerense]
MKLMDVTLIRVQETARYITFITINSDSVFFVDTRKLYSYLNSLNYSNDIYVVNLSDSKSTSQSINIPPSLSESISTLQSKLHSYINSHSIDSSNSQLISLTVDSNNVIPLTGVILTYPFVYYLDVSGGSSCLSTVDLIVTRVIYCIEDAKFNGSAREHVIISFSVPYLIMQEERLKQGGMRDRKRLESVEGVGRVKGVKVVYKSDRVDESVWSIPPLQKFWERLETVMVDESVKKNWSLEKLVVTVDVVNQGRIVL